MEKAELQRKAEHHVREQLGYKLLEKKSGFDICGIKLSVARYKYLAVGCNVNDEITRQYVSTFIRKLRGFKKGVDPGGLSSSSVEGLIAYSGNCTSAIRAMARAASTKLKRFY